MLNCFAGCSIEAIVGALGLGVRDLFKPSVGNPSTPLTVADLAADKALPEESLRSLGLKNQSSIVGFKACHFGKELRAFL